jgi:beta-N-acetylhexosaminidase
MSLGFHPGPLAQTDPAERILNSMTTAEKVGQLFLVTFYGNTVETQDPIFQLITENRIAGILLSEEYDNFSEGPEALEKLRELIDTLQGINYSSDFLQTEDGEVLPPQTSTYLPLFIGTKYEGGQHEAGSLSGELSPMASSMAIGATWDEEIALLSGEILGSELESLGVNLILGPALDVLQNTQFTGSADLGVRSFGGDPYWVSVLGESFITGIHTGSGGRIAVIASHFPGLGGSDRPIEEDVATVPKSLEQLKQFDLAPFLAVTRPGEDGSNGLVQGLLTSHIRYQGFQGNIRATTRPISLDPQAHELVMSLDPLNLWRANGGITMSDSLGSRAIRLFRDPTGQSFDARLVARDAFLAGNDLLLLENFRGSEDQDQFATILATLNFFETKYDEDQLFAERVDESVLRIIRLKLGLYGNRFGYPERISPVSESDQIGLNRQLATRISQAGATLISPDRSAIEDQAENIPRIGERIVFLTDVRYSQQCSTCSAEALMEANALESAVLRLFGPGGGSGQVGGWNLRSYTFADLSNYMGVRTTEPQQFPLASPDEIDEVVRTADWLIFSVLNTDASIYGANALQVFLDQRPDLARDKKVVVFSFDVPYGLDATEISKVDFFYALYDSGDAFVDMAAKLLFQEVTAVGSSPVSVPGIGYDLIEMTGPDPSQIIQLQIRPSEVEGEGTQVPEGYMIGDDITIQTGVILDSNGHRVPDQTPVEFLVENSVENVSPIVVAASTYDGRAETTIRIEQAGLLTISASTGNARISDTLQIDAQEDVVAQAIVISPTLIPTVTSAPTITPLVPTMTPDVSSGPIGALEGTFSSRLGALVLGMLAVAVSSVFGYYTANRMHSSSEKTIRYTLLPAIIGLLAYNYLALGLPGSLEVTTVLGGIGVFAVVSVGGALGLLLAYLWDRLANP